MAALLEQGADIEQGNNEGWTALFEAANKGHVETVRLLLKHGARPMVVDSSGSSPVDYARSNGDQQIIELLESVKSL